MSNVYNTEPPTKGKVTLKTTVGDLDIELWPKEAPKAVRNFVQLCLEGYYDGCIVHRIIKDFMAQTGDPTGTGEGGESIYSGPFKDEFHSRLKFNHRGQVACANRNEPHSNGSQFFITLDKCEWLDRKNTIFGKIVGDTVYNLLRMNDMEVDEATDRPVDPPRILSVDVLWNPFEDIVPRTTPEERKAQEQFKKADETRKERKTRKRNLALLSFGEQAEEEEQHLAAAAAVSTKIKSAHEVLRGDGNLLAPDDTPAEVLAEQQARAAALKGVQDKLKGAKRTREASSSSDDGDDSDPDRDRRKRRSSKSTATAAAIADRVKAAADKADRARAARAAAAAGEDGSSRSRQEDRDRGRSRDRSEQQQRGGGSSSSGGSSRSRSRGKGADQKRDAAATAAAAAAANGKAKSKEDQFYEVKDKQGPGRVRVDDTVADGELLKEFELSRLKYKTRKQQVGNRQKDTLARLAAFTNKLRTGNKQQQKQQQQQKPEQQQQQQEVQQAAAAAAAAKDLQATELAAAAAEAAAAAAQANGQQQQQQQQQLGDEAYDGKVRSDLDHRSYMPAAWRVDDYLNQEADDEDDLASLRQHKLEFSKASGAGVDAMARSDNLDDYVVFDPLLEAAKGKFSRAAQKEKKKQTQWAGRAQG